MKNRPYSWVFTAILVITGFSVVLTGSVAAQSTEFVDLNASDLTGTGTADNPYIITNASELQAMEDNLDAHYKLGSDIDASNTAQWNSGNGFDPVGGFRGDDSTPNPFTGSLHGNGHTVMRLTINRSTAYSVGLIGAVDSTDTVVNGILLKNITVIGGSEVGGLVGTNGGLTINKTGAGEITGSGSIRDTTVTGNITGTNEVGGLVGFNGGIIQNTTTTASVNGSQNVGGLVGNNNGESIQNATATGSITGSGDVGGLVGNNIEESTVSDSTATGKVTGSVNVGGLVGSNEGVIRNTTTTSNVIGLDQVGGLVGNNGGVIRNTTTTGNVIGSDQVGGLVGRHFESPATNRTATVRSATATGNVNGSDSVGGLVGLHYNGLIVNTKATGSVNGSVRVGGLVGGDFGNGMIRESFAVGYVNGSSNIGGLIGQNAGTVQGSYWNEQTTGQVTSSGLNATGLTTAQMTGQAAKTNMSELRFGDVWQTQPGGYPELVSQPSVDNKGNDSAQVQLSNISLTPQSVDSDSESTHQLSFEAQNISTDGNEDKFDITFPNKIELISYSDVEIDEKSSGVSKVDNTLEFSVNPTGSDSTQISGKLNVTLSATN